ncbi:MAG: hypoxanthine phosphoribosyltransferase [Bacteroidetes bacterium]|nr:hypoxanthine phosphoribosyltransferase [Bacteroidota bacterium]
MSTITVKDKIFSPFITADVLDKAVSKIAAAMESDLKGKDPLFLVVLNGAFVFASDLMKKLHFPCEISFIKLSSYSGLQTSNKVRELIGLNEDISGRTVVVLEDIIDTGVTLGELLEIVKSKNAADVKLAALLFKPNAFRKDYKIDYLGLEIPNDFIVGYGLDYDGFGRNYPDIYKIVE